MMVSVGLVMIMGSISLYFGYMGLQEVYNAKQIEKVYIII